MLQVPSSELEKFGCRRPLCIDELLAAPDPESATTPSEAEPSRGEEEEEPEEAVPDPEDSDAEGDVFVVPGEQEVLQLLYAMPEPASRPFSLSTGRSSGTRWLAEQQGLPTVCAPMQTRDDAELFDRLYEATRTRRGGVNFKNLARRFNQEVQASIQANDGRQIYCKTPADLKDYVKLLQKQKKADKVLETIAPEIRRLRKALRNNGTTSDLKVQFLTEERDRPARRVSRSQRRKRQRQNAARERTDASDRDGREAARPDVEAGAHTEGEAGEQLQTSRPPSATITSEITNPISPPPDRFRAGIDR